MKSDISIPNPVFVAAENLAKKMGVSLSELYNAALNAYVTEHQKENITEALDQVYIDEPSTLEPELVKMQVVSLEGEDRQFNAGKFGGQICPNRQALNLAIGAL